MQNFDNIWENILSEDKNQIESAFNNLNDSEQSYVISHLQKMTTEDGWHLRQITSASYALKVLSRGKSE